MSVKANIILRLCGTIWRTLWKNKIHRSDFTRLWLWPLLYGWNLLWLDRMNYGPCRQSQGVQDWIEHVTLYKWATIKVELKRNLKPHLDITWWTRGMSVDLSRPNNKRNGTICLTWGKKCRSIETVRRGRNASTRKDRQQ